MRERRTEPLSSRQLRADLSGRALLRGLAAEDEISYGTLPNLVFAECSDGGHGNFLPPSYRRIVAKPEWARRLAKSYTGSRYLPRAGDRWRGELECASSSDALLMNVFCYPGVPRRRDLCAQLGIEVGLQPRFGVRAELAMRKGEVDRTELDMCLGRTVVEAKLTETGFGSASRDRLLRYEGVEDMFEIEDLPRVGAKFAGYQIVRGILAAARDEDAYVVLIDERRADLVEVCFRVLRAVRRAEVRHRLRLRTWQEIAGALPRAVQEFLLVKYGIESH